MMSQLASSENGSLHANGTATPSDTVPFDVTGFLAGILGCRHRGLGESVALSAIYCVVLVTGVVGNVATCVVVVRNKYMHTATNYYLVSLAVSDMLVLAFGRYNDSCTALD